jgi:hypothetical protein
VKNYLAVFVGSPSSPSHQKWEAQDADTKQKRSNEGVKAWQAWAEKNATSIVQMGSPLGKTKKIGPEGISDIKNAIAGYTVVQAESYDAAAKLFLGHPHFTIFPGDSVEVMECLPMPGAKH